MSVVFHHFTPNFMPGGYIGVDIFFVILEIFLEAFCFLITPVLAIFINSEFNLGKNFRASVLFFFSNKTFIFFQTDIMLDLKDLVLSGVLCLSSDIVF